LTSITHHYLYYSTYTGWVSRRLLRYRCRTENITHIIAFNAENAELAVTANVDSAITLNVRGIRFTADTALEAKYRSIAKRSDWVVTNSENTARLLDNSGIADKRRIKVIHNGVRLPARGSQPRGKKILWVGSLKDVKDPMAFIEACRDVIRSDGDVKVVIVGDGTLRRDVERYVEENSLTENVTLLGEVPSAKIPYAEAAVFVNSSIRESSSNSLLEALSFGIPVVATDNPGNRNILSDLGHHSIVPIADPARMGDAIRKQLYIDDELRARIAEESRKHIEDDYSVSSMVDDYIRMFSNT
jgi:glycosyltransferase involved in cell wall biosynthesis